MFENYVGISHHLKDTYINNKVCFPKENKNLRTDIGFAQFSYENDGVNDGYQQARTNLNDIPNFGLVTTVVLDYMHLTCLGVMLKLIELWTSGPRPILSSYYSDLISKRLLSMENCVPSDFDRNPRSLNNIEGS